MKHLMRLNLSTLCPWLVSWRGSSKVLLSISTSFGYFQLVTARMARINCVSFSQSKGYFTCSTTLCRTAGEAAPEAAPEGNVEEVRDTEEGEGPGGRRGKLPNNIN